MISAKVTLNNLCSIGNTEYSCGQWDMCPLGEPLLGSSWLLPWPYVRVSDFLKKKLEIWGFMWDLPNFKIDTNIFKTPHGWNKICLPFECDPMACVISLLGLASLRYSNVLIRWDWDSPVPGLDLEGPHCLGLITRNEAQPPGWGSRSTQP